MGGDDASFSFISADSNPEFAYTQSLVTDQRTDDFELVAAADEDLGEEDELWDSFSEASTSATPSVYQHEFYYGRRYHGYIKGRYPLPNDESETSMEDLKHHMWFELLVGTT